MNVIGASRMFLVIKHGNLESSPSGMERVRGGQVLVSPSNLFRSIERIRS
jgi:hypothetical protein